MANNNLIRPEDLANAVSMELENYSKAVLEGVDKATEKAMRKLVKLTKASAPEGARGQFKKNITSKKLDSGPLSKARVWYVKSPDHRLTHLLVHGHATKNGGRVAGDPFLHVSLSNVIPEYEQEVEQVIRNGT